MAGPVNTVRYVVCGALTGYCFVAYGLIWVVPAGALGDLLFAVLIPVSLVGGSYFGYWHAKKKQARTTRVVHVLPERTQDSTHAAAA